MANEFVPTVKSPSKDNLYEEVMKPYEEGMNFFLNKTVTVDNTEVTEENKETVAGLESLIKTFTKENNTALVLDLNNDSFISYQGSEGFGTKIRKGIDVLIQFVKDAVSWLMSLINNKLFRIDNRTYRVTSRRKRFGLTQEDVKYPAGMRRLLVPNKVTDDAQWVYASLEDVNNFYLKTVQVYKDLIGQIAKNPATFDLHQAMSDVTTVMIRGLGMKQNGKNVEGTTSWVTDILPGNRYFRFDASTDNNTDRVNIYFEDTTMDVKLRSQTFSPTSFMIDKTLAKIKELVDNIRSNQKTVGELYRKFEKEVLHYEMKQDYQMTKDQKDYLRWLVRMNKKLCSLSIQYVTAAVDVSLDFCEAGIKE